MQFAPQTGFSVKVSLRYPLKSPCFAVRRPCTENSRPITAVFKIRTVFGYRSAVSRPRASFFAIFRLRLPPPLVSRQARLISPPPRLPLASHFDPSQLINNVESFSSSIGFIKEASEQYLKDLFNSVQLKDVVQRNSIRGVDLLERIVAYVMTNTGSTFSASSLAKYLKNEKRTVAPETILNYIRYCCDAYLFYQVKREDLQGKQILSSNEKYYIADHGIREAVFGGNMKDVNLILENIVYMELLRRGYDVSVGKNGSSVIDFVCTRKGERSYIQVAYLLASDETVEREFGAYKGIGDNYPKYVVTLDEIDMSRNGIKHLNIKDFLLGERLG